MCGIVAMLTNDRPIARHALQAATDCLRHRGPDGEGLWLADDERVGLGHRRLSIIDLVTGSQPMSNEDGTVHAIVNGEFYDYVRVQRELGARGHHLRSRSDSEILLHLYEEEGDACVRHLRGEFAFVLWDARRRRLFAARDRFGIKPLYYAESRDGLVLASEVKALFAAGVTAAWAPAAVYRALLLLPGRERTLFREVRQLPPGHTLSYAAGKLQVQSYWDLDYPIAPAPARDERDQIACLRQLIEEATTLRLQADVPVGCLLSGGIDSSALLGIASARVTDLPTFTAVFSETTADDIQAAHEAADAAGVTTAMVTVSDLALAEGLSAAVSHAETLGINLHGVGRFLLCERLRREGLRVALTGEGADEVFAGYVQFRQDAASAPDDRGLAALAGVRARLGFVPAWMEKIAVRDSIVHALLSREFAAAFDEADPFADALDELDLAGQVHGRPPLIQSLYLWTRTVLPNYVLFAERLEMGHGIEIRLPYLDHVLFEYVRTLDPSLLLRAGQEKYVLREAVRPFVPASVQRRAKQPFLAPPASARPDSPLHAVVREVLHSDAMTDLPFFDAPVVLALFDSLADREPHLRAALDAALMKVVCAVLLQRRFRLSH
jgi:asparagine synthase (glutamine-hydrolysing)